MLNEKISPYWQTLIERLEGAISLDQKSSHSINSNLKALRGQIIFSEKEAIILKVENVDPLGAKKHLVGENICNGRLVHQYKNRCLFLVTGSCFAHCRYCFRKESDAMRLPFASNEEIDRLCEYIAQNNDIKEVLLTGGDPLSTSDAKIYTLLSKIRSAKSDVIIRLATRAPIFAPERISDEFIRIAKEMKPLWIIPHINHPVEVCNVFAPEARSALERLINSGIPMQSQTVLLRGINDEVKTLSKLFNDLVAIGIKPGYLFQGDLAPGTSHFRLGLDDAIDLYTQLRHELSGLSVPTFAVDLPDGGGKVNLLSLTKEQYALLKELYA